MSFLIPFVVVSVAVMFTPAFTMSLPASGAEEQPLPSENLILLEIPVPEGVNSKRLDLDGDKLLLKGKNFSSLMDLENILKEERKGRSSDRDARVTPEPFSLVVPVARNFSSLKELFEILREDRAKPQKIVTGKEQSFVRGSEVQDSDLMIFFTS